MALANTIRDRHATVCRLRSACASYLLVAACADDPAEIQSGKRGNADLYERFYKTRIINPEFKDPPESFAIRRMLRNLF